MKSVIKQKENDIMLYYKFKDAVNQVKTVSKDDLYTGDGFECTDVICR